MRYSEVVEVEDVEEANRLIREALKESAVRLLSNRAYPATLVDLFRFPIRLIP